VVPEPVTDGVVDPPTGWLDEVLAGLAGGVVECASPRDAVEVSDAVRVDRIGRLERIKAAAAALQMAESVRFAQSQAKAQLAADVHPDKIGRGIADQLGLACQVSGFEAARRLEMARALWFELPETYRLLVEGEIGEYVASIVVSETRHLDAASRREVDRRITSAGIAQMGPRSAAACAPQACLRGRSGRLCAARPYGTEESSCQLAAGTGHDELPVGLPARRARRRLPKVTARPHRRCEGGR
jgi:hypothetical protein